MDREEARGFYEEDEDPDKVRAAFLRGLKAGREPRKELGVRLAQHIASRPLSEIQAAFRILGWPLKLVLVETSVSAEEEQEGEK